MPSAAACFVPLAAVVACADAACKTLSSPNPSACPEWPLSGGPCQRQLSVATYPAVDSPFTTHNNTVRAKGGRFLEAPVSGSKKPAIDGQLIILAAGDKSLFDDSMPAFEVMGKRRWALLKDSQIR